MYPNILAPLFTIATTWSSLESINRWMDKETVVYIHNGPGKGNGNPLQCSCLENHMDGWAWQAIVHGVALIQTWLNDWHYTSSNIQFSSVTQSCPTLCDPMNRITAGLPVHHQIPESTHTHVHWVNNAINNLVLCRPLLLVPSIFPSIRIFSDESALRRRWPNIGVSASTSVCSMNTQDWSPLG